MRLIVDQPQIVATFVGAGLGLTFVPPYTALGWVMVRPNGEWRLAAGAVFNDYNGSNVEISIYGPQALTRQSLKEALRYVFLQLRCVRLTAKTKRDNSRMRKLLPRLGFELEGTLKHYFGPLQSARVYRLDAAAAQKWM